MSEQIKVGDTVKHENGGVGTVVEIYNLDDTLVTWKFQGRYTTSNVSLLTKVDNKKYRWHK